MSATPRAPLLAAPSTPARILLDDLGWERASSRSVRVRGPGGSVSLTPLASAGGRVAFLHGIGKDRPLPGYAQRRELGHALARRLPGALVVYADPLRPACIWSWVERRAGRPAQYRERDALPVAGAANQLVVAAGSAGAAREPPLDAAAAELLVAALGRRFDHRRMRLPVGTRLRGAGSRGLRALHAAQQYIESSDDPAIVRRAWRALGGLAVLDPRCSTGDRLLAALQLLVVLYDACLERMRAWTAELARPGRPHRPEKLADFRRLLAAAAPAGADDSGRAFVIRCILRDNLFGVDPDANALRTCAERLLAAAAPARGEPVLNLRLGNAEAGFLDETELRRAAAADPAAAGHPDLAGELDVLVRAQRLVRRLALAEPGTGLAEVPPDPAIRDRFERLRERVHAVRARERGVDVRDPAAVRAWVDEHRPVHAWLEFAGRLPGRRFDVVLASRRAEAASRASTARDAADAAARPAPRVRDRGIPFPRPPVSAPAPHPAQDGEITRVERGGRGYPVQLAERLGSAAPATLHLRGETAILGLPLLAVFCSVRVPGDIILRTLELARALREHGTATAGGFQSPLERECMDLLLSGAQPLVVSPARCLDPFRVPNSWSRALAERRMLLVSAFDSRCRRPTVRCSQLRNRLVAAVASAVMIAHATPGGRLNALARELASRQAPLLTWADPHNADLVRLGAQPVTDPADCLAALPR